MGFVTSANIKLNVNSRCNPKLIFKSLHPKVLIFDPFAAESMKSGLTLKNPKTLLGTTEISAPVSTKKFKLFIESETKRRLQVNVF